MKWQYIVNSAYKTTLLSLSWIVYRSLILMLYAKKKCISFSHNMCQGENACSEWWEFQKQRLLSVVCQTLLLWLMWLGLNVCKARGDYSSLRLSACYRCRHSELHSVWFENTSVTGRYENKTTLSSICRTFYIETTWYWHESRTITDTFLVRAQNTLFVKHKIVLHCIKKKRKRKSLFLLHFCLDILANIKSGKFPPAFCFYYLKSNSFGSLRSFPVCTKVIPHCLVVLLR